jgi:hypothetical protein
MKKRTILRIAGVLLILGAIGFVYVYREYNRTHADNAKLKPDYAVDAIELEKEFSDNPAAAEKKYGKKLLEVRGQIKEIDISDPTSFIIVLGDTSSMNSIRCSIDSNHNRNILDARLGQAATVKGEYSGYNSDDLLGSDIVLIRCVAEILP